MFKSQKIIIFLLIFAYSIVISFVVDAKDDIGVYKNIDNNGRTQIFYRENDKEKKITDDNFPHTVPITNGQIIVWSSQVDAFWQIFFYDVYADKTIQFTKHGNNVNPKVFGNYIVWEGQQNGIWQVFLFDGVIIKQLTTGNYPSQNASIGNNFVTYTKKTKDDIWQVYYYDILLNKTVNLTPDTSGTFPTVEGDQIVWQNVNSESGEAVYYRYDTRTGETIYEGTETERNIHKSQLEEKLLARTSSKIKILPKSSSRDFIKKEISMIRVVGITSTEAYEEYPEKDDGIITEETGDTTLQIDEPLPEEVKESTESIGKITKEENVNESTTSKQ